jgi:phosphatidylglycerophosphate synthase
LSTKPRVSKEGPGSEPVSGEPPRDPFILGRKFSPVVVIVGDCGMRLFSLTPRQRLERQLSKLDNSPVVTLEQARTHQGPVVIIRADAVIDAPLLPVLLKRPNLVLLASDESTPVAAHVPAGMIDEGIAILRGESSIHQSAKLLVRSPGSLDADFWKTLRKRETPYALIVDEKNLAATEWRMFMGTYKGATDLVTKHVWPRPAFVATRWLAPRGVSPNMVTIVGIILVFLAFYLFLRGQFLPGLLAAWVMTFLDTVDGKLARTTLTSSKWGDVLDHGIDLVHPPFWYVAWAVGLGVTGYAWSTAMFWTVLAAILGGYILQRLIEGIAIKWLGLEIHIWRTIDTHFRQITARRNPNLILLTVATLAGRPDWGLIAVAVWTVVSLAFHIVQIAQALAARRAGPLSSWMSQKS